MQIKIKKLHKNAIVPKYAKDGDAGMDLTGKNQGMIANKLRIGRFTSSNIWKLMTDGRGENGFGAPAITYIEEKRAERCLGRSIDLGAHSQALTWGKVMEVIGFEQEMGIEYSLCSQETIQHPKYPFWSGSPDAKTSTKAVEMKCFYQQNENNNN